MSKPKQTFVHADKSRKLRAAIISDGKITCKPTQEFRQYLGAKRGNNNTTNRRVKDYRDGESMGLDYFIGCEGFSSIIPILFRNFYDPDVFIKESKTEDLLQIYADENALFLFTNDPLKHPDKKITHYRLWSMKDINDLGYNWQNRSDSDGNRNRLSLCDGNNLINPGKLLRIPEDGLNTLHEKLPSLNSALIQKFQQ